MYIYTLMISYRFSSLLHLHSTIKRDSDANFSRAKICSKVL